MFLSSMDCQQILNILAVLLALPAMSSAKEHVVGDDQGWEIGFDYTSWTKGRQFNVGDTLVFNYLRGDHNVYKVDEVGFSSCTVPTLGAEPLTSGNDMVELTTPGKKWYICGIPRHCSDAGQKLAITVRSSPPSLPPTPLLQPGAGRGIVVTRLYVVSVVMALISVIAMA